MKTGCDEEESEGITNWKSIGLYRLYMNHCIVFKKLEGHHKAGKNGLNIQSMFICIPN